MAEATRSPGQARHRHRHGAFLAIEAHSPPAESTRTGAMERGGQSSAGSPPRGICFGGAAGSRGARDHARVARHYGQLTVAEVADASGCATYLNARRSTPARSDRRPIPNGESVGCAAKPPNFARLTSPEGYEPNRSA